MVFKQKPATPTWIGRDEVKLGSSARQAWTVTYLMCCKGRDAACTFVQPVVEVDDIVFAVVDGEARLNGTFQQTVVFWFELQPSSCFHINVSEMVYCSL